MRTHGSITESNQQFWNIRGAMQEATTTAQKSGALFVLAHASLADKDVEWRTIQALKAAGVNVFCVDVPQSVVGGSDRHSMTHTLFSEHGPFRLIQKAHDLKMTVISIDAPESPERLEYMRRIFQAAGLERGNTESLQAFIKRADDELERLPVDMPTFTDSIAAKTRIIIQKLSDYTRAVEAGKHVLAVVGPSCMREILTAAREGTAFTNMHVVDASSLQTNHGTSAQTRPEGMVRNVMSLP